MQVNNQEVVANHYTYRLQGTSYEGMFYKNGVGLPMDSAVIVEFLSRNPAVSRIKGMRVSHAPAWAILLVGAFPFFGGCVSTHWADLYRDHPAPGQTLGSPPSSRFRDRRPGSSP
jgi:hypothetical protein